MPDIEYWRPEPTLYDLMFGALLLPAIIYVTGVCVYGLEAMSARDPVLETQLLGSALMVIGGELGTIATVMEVWRKYVIKATNMWDWIGIVVSLLATLGNLFIIFSRQTTIARAWVELVRNYGPLVLLLCSGLDFYATAMELGFRWASFDTRWREWNDARHNWEQARLTSARKETEPPTVIIEPEPKLTRQRATHAEWTAMLADLDGDRVNLDADRINELLWSHGFERLPQSTARYWAKKAQEREA